MLYSQRNNHHIALITHSLSRGGSPISLWNLARGLKAQGYRVNVISEKNGDLFRDYETIDATPLIFPRAGLLQITLLWNFIRFFYENKTKLVHLNTLTSYYKYPALAAWILDIPVVWWVREDVKAKRCQRILSWLKFFSTKIIPVSQEMANNIDKENKKQQIQVIYNGIEPSHHLNLNMELKMDLGIPQEAFVIGCIAAIEPRKGQIDVIRALAKLGNPGRTIHVVFVGKASGNSLDYYQNLQEESARLPDYIKVHFTGSIAEAKKLYLSFDLNILPTYWEGCSRTLLEAMSLKCPILTTTAGGNPEMLEHQKSAWLYTAGDTQQLHDAFNVLIHQHDLRRNLAEEAYKTFENRFTQKHHDEQVNVLYKKLIEENI